FLVDQWFAHDSARWSNESRESRVLPRKKFFGIWHIFFHCFNDFGCNGRAGDYRKQFTLESMCCCPDFDRLSHIVIRRGNGQRNIIGDVDEFSLCKQRKSRERVRVFATSQCSNWTNISLVNFQRRTVSGCPCQFFCP